MSIKPEQYKTSLAVKINGCVSKLAITIIVTFFEDLL